MGLPGIALVRGTKSEQGELQVRVKVGGFNRSRWQTREPPHHTANNEGATASKPRGRGLHSGATTCRPVTVATFAATSKVTITRNANVDQLPMTQGMEGELLHHEIVERESGIRGGQRGRAPGEGNVGERAGRLQEESRKRDPGRGRGGTKRNPSEENLEHTTQRGKSAV